MPDEFASKELLEAWVAHVRENHDGYAKPKDPNHYFTFTDKTIQCQFENCSWTFEEKGNA